MQSPIEKGYLLLADISGFTQFLADTELDHAPQIVGNIVSFLTKHLTPALEIVEIEGDAVFACACQPRLSRGELLLEMIEETYTAFRDHQRTMAFNITCGCMACQAVPGLDLKFVAHYGDYARQELAGKTKPVGTSVNLVHRLLKNGVSSETGWRAYALFTSDCLKAMDVCPQGLHYRTETYQHLGPVETASVNLDESYRRKDENRVVRIEEGESDVRLTVDLDSPPPIVWDWMSDPVKRGLWMVGSDWEVKGRPSGRTDRTTQNHCTNSKFIESVLDWRPFDYFTVRYKRGPLDLVATADLVRSGGGTKLDWKMRMNGALPRPILRTGARLIARHLMHVEQGLGILKKISSDPDVYLQNLNRSLPST